MKLVYNGPPIKGPALGKLSKGDKIEVDEKSGKELLGRGGFEEVREAKAETKTETKKKTKEDE